MKLALLAALLVAAGVSGEANFSGLRSTRSFYESRFTAWQAKFGVAITESEYEMRLQNFAHAEDRISRHNADPSAAYTMAHNPYSAMSWLEFRGQKGIGRPMQTRPAVPFKTMPQAAPAASRRLTEDDLPKEVDWRVKGAVTPVKNQGACGSCWSFSTTGAMEGAYYLNMGGLESFSEQMLVDCDTYDSGCGGGLMDFSFHWIQENGGICREAEYPYSATGGVCAKSACSVVPGTTVASWVDVEPNKVDLMAAVAKQPVSVAIEADEMAFQFYADGVLMSGCGTSLDHGVLLVGYGTTEDGIDYWTLKNSWGPEWGDSGYIRVLRGAEQTGGECGILQSASYPVLMK